MRTRVLLPACFLAVALVSCNLINKMRGNNQALPVATIVREGLINCFEKDLSLDGKPVWCEASAILYDGKKLFIANDKEMPANTASVFTMPFENGFFNFSQSTSYSTHPLLRHAKKFEDFALTPDGKFVLLTTAFDRVQPGNKSWDGYNSLVYWKTGDENNPHVMSESGVDSNSVCYRNAISQALKSAAFPDGPPYFKIEGLAASGGKLYWGVRETGKKYDDFTYKIIILSTPYKVEGDRISIGAFSLVTDIPISSINPGNHPMALSSIEYDPYNKRFLLLTSYEEKDAMGGYLWIASEEALQKGQLTLVKDKAGMPLSFHNKCEDLAVINKHRIIVIHDDDRMKPTVAGETREPYQAAYSVVEY